MWLGVGPAFALASSAHAAITSAECTPVHGKTRNGLFGTATSPKPVEIVKLKLEIDEEKSMNITVEGKQNGAAMIYVIETKHSQREGIFSRYSRALTGAADGMKYVMAELEGDNRGTSDMLLSLVAVKENPGYADRYMLSRYNCVRP